MFRKGRDREAGYKIPRLCGAELHCTEERHREICMDGKQIADSVAYCGLVCGLCSESGECSCRSGNHCGKRVSPAGCYQYACCSGKGLRGCWECEEAPCGTDMFDQGKIKIRAFIRCIKEDGLERFSEYMLRNIDDAITYHRTGIFGDYDLQDEQDVLDLLRYGRNKTV